MQFIAFSRAKNQAKHERNLKGPTATIGRTSIREQPALSMSSYSGITKPNTL